MNKLTTYPLGKVGANWLQTLNKLSICLPGKTPSAPSVISYQATTRRQWHEAMKGRGKPFNLSIFNENLFRAIREQIRDQDQEELVKKASLPLPSENLERSSQKTLYFLTTPQPPPLPATLRYATPLVTPQPPYPTQRPWPTNPNCGTTPYRWRFYPKGAQLRGR